MQSTLNEPDGVAWNEIAPLLDEAMGRLGKTDRNAVVLRFFENKTAAEVAAKMTARNRREPRSFARRIDPATICRPTLPQR